MSDILEKTKLFFNACETGKGWDGCSEYCHPDATFSAQASALADVNTLEAYTEWMKGLFTPVPDGRYELRFFAEDEEQVDKWLKFRDSSKQLEKVIYWEDKGLTALQDGDLLRF